MESFPTGAAYVDALHHPATCLTDPRLAGARVELTELGWPRPRSGASACVFRLDGADGARYALKCFTRSCPDQQQRYAAIAEQLAAAAPSADPSSTDRSSTDRSSADGSSAGRPGWQVTFEYQDEGILVEGRRWPVLAMEWVDDAVDLARFVGQYLHRPALLGRLAEEFAATCADLGRRGIAHGDLQHGNVLVTGAGARIRLIDYDGMWVPGLAGRPGVECGQPNYQHPARLREHAGPGLDHFSGWAIYVSLLATATDAGLWQRADGGDECLLFRAADYADPDRSAVFDALAGSSVPVVRRAAARLAELCRAPDPDQVPPLDAGAFPVPKLPGRRRAPRVWILSGTAPARAATAPTGATTPGTTSSGASSSSWAATSTGASSWPPAAPAAPSAAGAAAAPGSPPGPRRTAAPRRRHTPTSSRWSRRPPLVRALRSVLSVQRGRLWPGGVRPRPHRDPVARRALGIVAMVAGAIYLIAQFVPDGGSGPPTASGFTPTLNYQPPAAISTTGSGISGLSGTGCALTGADPLLCGSGSTYPYSGYLYRDYSAYLACLRADLLRPRLPEGLLESALGQLSTPRPGRAAPSRRPSPSPSPSPTPGTCSELLSSYPLATATPGGG